MIVETSNQILGGDGIVILWNVDGSSNGKDMLDQCWGNSDYSLNWNFATFLLIDRFTVAGRRRKVGVEIGIAQTPGWRYVKPGVGRWDRNLASSPLKRSIEQFNIRNANIR